MLHVTASVTAKLSLWVEKSPARPPTQRHEDAIAGLFGEVLCLCADAGLAGVGVLAVDGTKVHANASHHANRDYEQLAREILEEAKTIDAAEDELYGDRRGDELPPELATADGRRAWLRGGQAAFGRRAVSEQRANDAYEAYWARGIDKRGRALSPGSSKPTSHQLPQPAR